MRITQGTFSYLPDLTDEEITAQINYALSNDWPLSVEFTDDPHPPQHLLGDVGGPADVRPEGPRRRPARGQRLPQGNPRRLRQAERYDAGLGRQTTALSFIVQRPADEPGFRVDRTEVRGRAIQYSTHSYATERPAGDRYDQG